ncbi:SMI1/KNR4 family protein [Streptomyces sp. NPDC056534]|uniref:SMI1/KNR4 family protein n=1 Tax=Streptomyces sp. NPDC056534 TaxID=3345857 RepID=UPI0036AE5AF8
MYVDESMEVFIARLVPAVERAAWRGAPEAEIAEVEGLAGRPLPEFYRWFIATMGGSYPHAVHGYTRQDLRVATVIDAYRHGLVEPDLRFLLIGRIYDPAMPELLFYDLDTPVRKDAMVLTRSEFGLTMRRGFETLREKLAWGMLRRYGITPCSQRCEGSFRREGASVKILLDPVMSSFGFTCPIETGSYCALYERDDAAMACLEIVEDSQDNLLFFQFGGRSPMELRTILAELATTSIDVQTDRWHPPLPT